MFASYMLVIINGFASLPISSVKLDNFDPVWLWVYFAAPGIILWLTSRKKTTTETSVRVAVSTGGIPKKWIIAPLLVVATLTTLVAYTMPDNRLRVSFFDVGQGDAILIQTPNHQDILADDGPSAQAVSGELGKRLPFWDRTIELVVLTHPHTDHLNGLLEVPQSTKLSRCSIWIRIINQRQSRNGLV